MKRPPSTSCSANEARVPTARSQPGPDRGGDRAGGDRGRVHLVQRQHRPSVRPELPAQGRGAERREAREGQRGARGRIPRGHRRGHPERPPPGGRGRARDRDARPQARQAGRAAVRGLNAVGASALGARAQVRGADPGPRPSHVPGRRHDPAAEHGGGLARARGRALDLRAGDPRRRPQLDRGLRERDRGARAGHQHGHPRARAVHALPAAGDGEPLRPGHRAAEPLPCAGRGGRRGGARGRAAGALVRRHGDHLRGHVARSRGAPPDDRGEPGDAVRRHRVVPGADALPRAVRGGVARPPAGRRTAPAHAAARERRPPGRGAGVPADPGARRGPREPVRGGRGARRQPDHAARAARPPQGRRAHPAADQVRRAVPDGLQLPRLLLQPARHAPVLGGGRRHQRADSREARRRDAGEHPRLDGVHPSGRRADGQGPAGHPGAAVPPYAVRRPGRRLQRPGGLPGRPDGLPRQARDGPALPAGLLERRLRRRRQPRRGRPGHAGPDRRHLQVTRARHRPPGGRAVSVFKAGVLAITVIVLLAYFGFTFANPYELKALFRDVENLKVRSPVRIAGVEVGKVTKVESKEGGGAAEVTMELREDALPLHEDARLQIRSRIFLEGNFFVDIEPGSPSGDELDDGSTVPVTQTATTVTLPDILDTLDTDVRGDLQTFLHEYGTVALQGGGARAFNRAVPSFEPAYRYGALTNDALLGLDPERDIQRLLRGQQKTFAALSANPRTLRELVTDLNTTAGAIASADTQLEAAIPALRDTLTVGYPALGELNAALPTLSA